MKQICKLVFLFLFIPLAASDRSAFDTRYLILSVKQREELLRSATTQEEVVALAGSLLRSLAGYKEEEKVREFVIQRLAEFSLSPGRLPSKVDYNPILRSVICSACAEQQLVVDGDSRYYPEEDDAGIAEESVFARCGYCKKPREK